LILYLGNTRARITLLHHSLDLYWLVKARLGKTLTEREKSYADILGQLEKVYTALVPLRTIPYHLKIIEAK